MTLKLGGVIAGDPARPGATPVADGTNFAFYTGPAASELFLCPVDPETRERGELIPFSHRTEESVWHGFVPGMKEGDLYNVYVNGPWDPVNGLRYNPFKALVDPRAKAVVGKVNWADGVVYGYDFRAGPNDPDRDLRMDTRDSFGYAPMARIVDTDKLIAEFGGARPQHSLIADGPVWEIHPKGATKLLLPHASAYEALASDDFIRGLKKGGAKIIQVMPLQEHVDEHFLVNQGKTNYWGYNTIAWFAAEQSFAKGPRPERELLIALRKLRDNGIDVIMDVAYGHTPEGSELGPTLSFRGFEPFSYHHESDRRRLSNPTGCGNAVNLDYPKVREVVLDSLKYYHNYVAGFRFDHGHTLGREGNGNYNENSKANEEIRAIVEKWGLHSLGEGWDLNGYSVGSHAPFAHFNDRFRENIKRAAFDGKLTASGYSNILMGSHGVVRDPAHGVNYISSHDDETLRDMAQHIMGLSDEDIQDPAKQKLLQSRMQFAMTLLAVSVGIPFVPIGHASGHSNHHVRDTYNIDDETTWINWKGLEPWQRNCFASVKRAFEFRRKHGELQRTEFPALDARYPETGRKEIEWYNTSGTPMRPEQWNEHCFSYVLSGRPVVETRDRRNTDGEANGSGDNIKVGPDVLIMVNGWDDKVPFTLPELPPGERWMVAHDSAITNGRKPSLRHRYHHPGEVIELESRSALICEGGRMQTLQPALSQGSPGASI